MCSVTTLMSFRRIVKLRTSPSCWTGTWNYSGFQLNSSFITFHSSDSFTLSFFLFSSCSALASNCLGRRTTCVLFRPQRYVFYICHFPWLLPLKHDSMTYQVQIKFMNFQRRYLVRIIQLLSFNVVVIFFQPLRFLPFTFSSSLFLTHFNLSKVINIVLLHKLQRDNTVPGKFSFCLVFSWI